MDDSLSKRGYKLTNHQQVSLVVIPMVFTALALVFTGLRIYARRLKKLKVLADDYLCVAACILALALLGGDIAMVVAAGGAKSMMSLKNPNDLFLWLKMLIITYLIWCAAIAVVQFAILFLYQRLFFVVDWFRRAAYIIMGLVFAWFIAAWASDLAICNPTKKLWEPMTPGTCGDGKKMCTIIGLFHAILDFTILMIPMPLIWNLKTTTMNKVFISILLLFGVFATVSALLRLECLFNLSHYNSMDLPNYMWLPLIYHFSEVPVAIICCCIPALPPVIEAAKLSSFGSYARSMFSRKSTTSVWRSSNVKNTGNSSSSFQKGITNGSETNCQIRKPSDEIPLGSYQTR